MEKIIKHLTIHGAANTESVFKALLLAGIVTDEATTQNIAALVVGITAPPFSNLADYVLERLNATNDDGVSFGVAIRCVLETDPDRLDVSQIVICQNLPRARINLFEKEPLEFEHAVSRRLGIRTECIISGALVLVLALCTGHTAVN